MKWYLIALKKYFVFNGRARRKEFWMFALFNFIFLFLAIGLDNILGTTFNSYDSQKMIYGYFYLIYALAVFIPGLAVTVRRLQDTGRSGFLILLSLIPIIGAIWLIILLCYDSTPGYNGYGKNPKMVSSPGNGLSEEDYETQIINNLQQGKKAGVGLLVSGYIFSILGGLIGLIIAQSIAFSKIKTRDGSKVFIYDEQSRKHGQIMYTIAFIMMIASFILWLYAIGSNR